MEMKIEIENVDEGNISGNYEERHNALKWAIGDSDVQSIKNCVNALMEFTGTFITTQQMKKMCNYKMSKINYLIKNAGFGTTDRLKYHDTVSNHVSKKTIIKYHENKFDIISEKEVVSVGSLYRARWIQTFKVLTPIEDIENYKKRMVELKNKDIEYFDRIREQKQNLWQEKCLNFLFSGEIVKDWRSPELTDRQEKKILSFTQRYYQTRCPKCQKIIRFPLCSNADEDKSEGFAFSLYTIMLNEVHDNGCKECNKNSNHNSSSCSKWNYKGMSEFINDLDKNKWLKFSVSDFCKEFRNDGVVVKAGYLMGKLRELGDVKTTKMDNDNICVLVC